MIQGTEWFSLQDLNPSLFKKWVKSPAFPYPKKTLRGAEWKATEDEMLLFLMLEASLLFKKNKFIGYFNEDLSFVPLGTESEITAKHFKNFGLRTVNVINSEKIKNSIIKGENYSIVAFEEHHSNNDYSDSFLVIEGKQKDKLLELLESLENKDLGKMTINSSFDNDRGLYCVANEGVLKLYKNNTWITVKKPFSADSLMTAIEMKNLNINAWKQLEGEVALASLMTNGEFLTSYTEDKYMYDESPIIKDIKFYIVNTTAKIEIGYKSNILQGVLDNADSTNVQYSVILNGKKIFPANTDWTRPLKPPFDVAVGLDINDVHLGVENTLKIIFKDTWGTEKSWATKFIGERSGLMFYDVSGELHSTEIGEVLKYLDFGVITAGQTTIEHEVVIKNQYAYDVTDLKVWVETPKDNPFPDGVEAQISKTLSPFISEPTLKYDSIMRVGEEKSLYVRLSTTLGATPNAAGSFDIKVKAKKVE